MAYLTWSPEGEINRRPEIKWGKKVQRALKYKHLTPEEAVNRQVWRKATEKQ
jgi:hypothetical protein